MPDNESALRDLLTGHLTDMLLDRWKSDEDVLVRDEDGGWTPLAYADAGDWPTYPIVAWEDVTDPTNPVPDRCACALVSFESPEGVRLDVLVRGWNTGELLRGWTGFDYVD